MGGLEEAARKFRVGGFEVGFRGLLFTFGSFGALFGDSFFPSLQHFLLQKVPPKFTAFFASKIAIFP